MDTMMIIYSKSVLHAIILVILASAILSVFRARQLQIRELLILTIFASALVDFMMTVPVIRNAYHVCILAWLARDLQLAVLHAILRLIESWLALIATVFRGTMIIWKNSVFRVIIPVLLAPVLSYAHLVVHLWAGLSTQPQDTAPACLCFGTTGLNRNAIAVILPAWYVKTPSTVSAAILPEIEC